MNIYSVKTLTFEDGERYPIWVDREGMPHFFVTLWVTSQLRAKNKAYNTLLNKIHHVKLLLEWESAEQRNFYSEFKRGEFLSSIDIENIRNFLSKHVEDEKSVNALKNAARNKVISFINSPKLIKTKSRVGRNHHYNRMTSAIEYLIFIANVATGKAKDKKLVEAVKQMESRLRKQRPKGKATALTVDKPSLILPEEAVIEFLQVTHFNHPKNPFKHEASRFRNFLMFHLFEKHGIRRGELLSLTVNGLTLHGNQQSFWIRRTHDDELDPRANQPATKTKERLIRISDETADLIDCYIRKYRSKTPNASTHPYLFVVHRGGDTQGQPVSISTFDNTIVQALKNVDKKFETIHAHYFRHYWNVKFSQKVDLNNEKGAKGEEGYKIIGEGEEAKMRMHIMGHTSEESGRVYNERHIAKKANELALQEQNDLKQSMNELKALAN